MMFLVLLIPFIVEDRIEERVPPTVLHPLSFALASFIVHANLLQHMRGRDILCNTLGPDTMQAHTLKAEGQQSLRGLGGIALAPEALIELIPQISTVSVWTLHTDAAIADEL